MFTDCVLVSLPPVVSLVIRTHFFSRVGSDDLALDGREDFPHVTCLYGLKADPSQREVIYKDLLTWGSISFQIRELSFFETPEADVLHFRVSGCGGLDLANERLSRFSYQNSYSGYTPHITLAYLKPGKGARYISKPTPLLGKEIQALEVQYSVKSDLGVWRTTLSRVLPPKAVS